MKKDLEILSLFLEITILKINSEGEILKTILNTKTNLKTENFKTIYTLFSSEEEIRLKRLLESGIKVRKKFFKLNKKTKLEEYVDVEVSESDSGIFLFIKFVPSNETTEAEYDRHVEKLAIISGKDPMTKVLNRHGLEEQFRKLVHGSDPKKRIGLVYIDMDNLKDINDTYGHVVGDKAILNITNILTSAVRDRDLVCRLGGDEFIIVVEEVTGERSTAYGLAKRLLRVIKKSVGKKYHTTASIGVHVFEVSSLSNYTDNLKKFTHKLAREIDLADKATYEAKRAGKNQMFVSKSYRNFYKLNT